MKSYLTPCLLLAAGYSAAQGTPTIPQNVERGVVFSLTPSPDMSTPSPSFVPAPPPYDITINFDDLNPHKPIPSDYLGFSWRGVSVASVPRQKRRGALLPSSGETYARQKSVRNELFLLEPGDDMCGITLNSFTLGCGKPASNKPSAGGAVPANCSFTVTASAFGLTTIADGQYVPVKQPKPNRGVQMQSFEAVADQEPADFIAWSNTEENTPAGRPNIYLDDIELTVYPC